MSNQNICNICGANYEYINGRWKCPACGAYKAEELSNEEVTLLYNAAQKLRLADFDEAERLYTDIIEKYTRNHSGYWGRLLSKYGIKYEEDFDGRKIPTCYATSIESVISDKDYLKAIQYADVDTKEYYQKQAEYIERVRKEWVEKASKEEPYDIFICYKDSDLANDIDRTHDSIEAQDLYIHLTAQGYRVFYSRESLRDKVGEKYEPYIFNALSTAKVMLVYGTSAEYITSTWLKNEWTRYEKRISLGEKLSNSLLVICDGFSPTELPKALASMQCFDAKRKTFYTDLDRCVKQIMSSSPIEVNYNSKEVSKTQSPLHEHRYKTSIVKSTCIAKGYTVHKCNCGYEYKDTYTPLVDHEYKVTKREEATCASDGSETRICDVCGEKQVTVLPRLPHQFSRWAVQERASCTESGKSQRKCLVCGEIETKELPATGHEFGVWGDNSNNSTLSYCRKCGVSKSNKAYSNSTGIGNATSSRSDNIFSYEPESTEKNSTKAWGMFILCLFFGFTGIHKFIEKKTGYGLLYLFTAGLFYYGWIKDCINYYKIAKNSTPNANAENTTDQCIGFSGILFNILDYWKAFFTKRTTRAQKIKHWIGCSITLIWVLMFVISILAFYYNNPNNSEAIEISPYWIFALMADGILWLCAHSAVSKEKKRYLKQGTPYPLPLNNRLGLRIISNFLLVIAATGFATIFAPDPSERITGLMMCLIFGVWTIITTIYSHCPKQYKNIQFASTSNPVHKSCLVIIGVFITWVTIIVLGIIGGTTGA